VTPFEMARKANALLEDDVLQQFINVPVQPDRLVLNTKQARFSVRAITDLVKVR
jgi:hypothetical protein